MIAMAACSPASHEREESSTSRVTAACPEGAIKTGDACTSFLSLSCAMPAVPAVEAVKLTTDRVFTTPFRGESYAAPQALDVVHGQDDGTVPIAQSRAMRDALRTAGVTVGLMELPGQGHGFPFFGTSGSQPCGACSTLAFLAHF